MIATLAALQHDDEVWLVIALATLPWTVTGAAAIAVAVATSVSKYARMTMHRQLFGAAEEIDIAAVVHPASPPSTVSYGEESRGDVVNRSVAEEPPRDGNEASFREEAECEV